MVDFLLENGLSASEIGRVLLAYPQAFQFSIDHHAQPAVDFLRDDLGLNRGEVRQLLTRLPSILGMNVKGQLRPQLAYLRSLGLTDESLPSLVLSRPLVLGPGIETVIKFLSRCGLPRSQLHRLLRSYPLDYCMHFKGFVAAVPQRNDRGGGGGEQRWK